MRIEIVVFDGFDDLDAFAPHEVLSHAARRLDGWEVALVAVDAPREVVSAHGVRIHVEEVLGGDPDGVIVAGGGWQAPGSGVRAEVERGEIPRHLAELAPRLRWTASVCTGAMLLAAAGLTRGRPAATHPSAQDDLAAAGAQVRRDSRVVDDGNLLTAGAVTSGFDLALHLISREADPATARAVADFIAYRPESG